MAKTEELKNYRFDVADEESPKDRGYIVYILFFSLGVVNILPWSFFVKANAYWMYKFRNTSLNEISSETRTDLQTQFASILTISLQLATIVFHFLTLIFGHKFRIEVKSTGTLCIILVLFVIEAACIKIDTDSWQTGFFALTMAVVTGINGMNSVFVMSVYSIVSNFPHDYLGAFLNGQGLSGIISSSLQIISLATGMATLNSALVYFSMGIGIIAFSLMLLITTKYNKFYRCNMKRYQEGQKEKMIPLKNIALILRKIWPSIVGLLLWILTTTPLDSSITALVVSEGEGSGEWSDVYFVPVITFLFSSIGELIGRIIAVKMNNFSNGVWFVLLSLMRMLIFIPLLMLCNAQPRHYLPVIFPHDYEYIIIMAAFSITNGYFMSMTSLMIPKLVSQEELEDAFHVYMVCFGLFLGIFCFTSFISVQLL